MAKKFSDYTVEDLYRNNFSFLIKGIKDKELEETGLSEEAFIKAQKLALMNIFTCLNHNEIDTNKQVIGPFLFGRRLLTDINSIALIVEGIKKTVPVVRDFKFELSDFLSKDYASCDKILGSRNFEKEIEIHRLNIIKNTDNMNSRHRDAMSYARMVNESRTKLSETIAQQAFEMTNPENRSDRLGQFIGELQKHDFRIVRIEKQTSGTRIVAIKLAHTRCFNPNTNSDAYLPLFVPVNFLLQNNGIDVTGNKDFLYYSTGRMGDYFHPHISSGNSFCLGNTATLLSTMMENNVYRSLPDFVQLYSDLLDTYNSGSPYSILENCFMHITKFFVGMDNVKMVDVQKVFKEYESYYQLESLEQPTHTESVVIRRLELFALKVKNSLSSGYSAYDVKAAIFAYLRLVRQTLTLDAIALVENSAQFSDSLYVYLGFMDASIYGKNAKVQHFAAMRQFINDTELGLEEVTNEDSEE